MGSYFNVLSAAAVVATTFTATVSLAVEATKEASYSGKINLTGKVTDMVRSGSGLNNAWAYNEDGTSFGDPPMKVHCFGVGQEVNGVMETRAYCVHTDNDGDQIAWKSMEAPHRHAPIITRTEEVLMGTGKFDGRTGTQSLDCAYSQGPTDDLSYGCECEVHGKYMMP